MKKKQWTAIVLLGIPILGVLAFTAYIGTIMHLRASYASKLGAQPSLPTRQETESVFAQNLWPCK